MSLFLCYCYALASTSRMEHVNIACHFSKISHISTAEFKGLDQLPWLIYLEVVNVAFTLSALQMGLGGSPWQWADRSRYERVHFLAV